MALADINVKKPREAQIWNCCTGNPVLRILPDSNNYNTANLRNRSRLNFYDIQDLPLFLRRFWVLNRECSELHDR